MLHRKSRWRTWLGKRGELWYYDGGMPETTADKPHRWTIAIGLLAPTIAIVAVSVSYLALQTSQTSMKVGQRAYLGFDLESMTAENATGPAGPYVLAKSRLKVKNLGNTPAYLNEIVQRVNIVDTHDPDRLIGGTAQTRWNVDSLAPKNDVTVNYEGICLPDQFRIDRVVEYSGEVRWHDVFNQQHTDDWCMAFDPFTFARLASCPKSQ